MLKSMILLFLFAILLMSSLFAETAQDTRTVETFPYTENFESATMPAGWTIEDTNTDGITWAPRFINGYSAPYAMGCDYSFYVPMDDWFFTPSLHLINGVTYRAKFSYKCEVGDYPEKLEVKWGEAANSTSMTSAAIYTNTQIVNQSFQEVTVSFNVTPQGRDARAFYYIGWHGFSDTYQWTLWVDNITIEEMPSVPIFASSIANHNFGNQQISYNSAPKYITITNAGGGLLPLSSCSLVGTDASHFELIDLNTYSLSIDAFSSKQVGIRFHPQSVGAKSVSIRFMENGTIIHDIPITGFGIDNTVTTFPFSQNFEAGVLPANWIKLADGVGWRFGSNLGRGSFTIPLHTIYAAVNKNTSIFEYDPLPGRNDFLIPPPFNLANGEGIPHLTFRTYFTALQGMYASVEYSTDGATWNLLSQVPVTSIGWKFVDINLNAFKTSTRFFVRFHADDMGIANATGWAIDDVNLLFVDPVPVPPINVQIMRSGTNVRLTWDPVLYVSGYVVYSAPDYYSDLWTLETPVPVTDPTWTGNTSLYMKYFKVKSVR